MSVPPRSAIRPGLTVDIVQKHHQRSGQLTRGAVAALLTSSATHPHGIKVRLTTREVGRVQALAVPDH
ncbi:YwbE family protein [Deinococcus sp. ZS9-10]|uniref:YwbE family protein n=1 Tax=Deinococcus arenicola TaxID=2994950 RepID=A0ABU4DLS2_9DEIO|nr:YwbE family protein [Deinococcus sp. ZS9-10]